jgi:hypothetical protein
MRPIEREKKDRCTNIAKSSDRCEFDSLPLDSTVTAAAQWNVLERGESSSEGTELCSFSESCLLGLMTECHIGRGVLSIGSAGGERGRVV